METGNCKICRVSLPPPEATTPDYFVDRDNRPRH